MDSKNIWLFLQSIYHEHTNTHMYEKTNFPYAAMRCTASGKFANYDQ